MIGKTNAQPVSGEKITEMEIHTLGSILSGITLTVGSSTTAKCAKFGTINQMQIFSRYNETGVVRYSNADTIRITFNAGSAGIYQCSINSARNAIQVGTADKSGMYPVDTSSSTIIAFMNEVFGCVHIEDGTYIIPIYNTITTTYYSDVDRTLCNYIAVIVTIQNNVVIDAYINATLYSTSHSSFWLPIALGSIVRVR